MLQTHESAIDRSFVSCVVLMETIFPCFNLKHVDCNLATTILVHKLYQLHKTIIPGKGWLEFLRLEWS